MGLFTICITQLIFTSEFSTRSPPFLHRTTSWKTISLRWQEQLPNPQFSLCWICLLPLTQLPPDRSVNPKDEGHHRNHTPVVQVLPLR